jgi:hypothetical protein
MQLIQVAPNHFVNPTQIVEVIYAQPTTRDEKSIDYSNFGKEKTSQVAVPSVLTIKLISGGPLKFSGAEADALYSRLTESFLES